MGNTNLRSNKIDSLTTKQLDFHGRRITNAADAVDDQDYVTLAQLRATIKGIAQVITQSVNNVTNSTTITSSAIVDDHSLTSATTTISASVVPAPASGLLIVILRQDATGGRLATGSGTSFVDFPSTINKLANAVSVIIFVADSVTNKWRMAAPGKA